LWKFFAVGIGIHAERHVDLAQVAHALESFCPLLGAGKRRQQQSRQNADDGDDDQKFNQGKSGLPTTSRSLKGVCLHRI